RRGAQAVDQTVGELWLDRCRCRAIAAGKFEFYAPLRCDLAKRARRALQQFAKIDTALVPVSARLDLGCKIEVVDRAQQHSRLAHDFACPLAISAVSRTEILSIDDLCEADDCVKRRLELVHQLA